ncbi:chemotaxis protein CheA [Aromatoleum buckelii]|uniref:Chemotaxis protein CheA n=1 Tax=Aromatoleum buckelii TaxID=200254 RepID=A0ABX1N5X8_9RHOO|nr:chemotaxis protein CheA [Aromatoleum buckelii]MCK0509618.1 chemotaxis protein CheA [Aromatoleum buckelii]
MDELTATFIDESRTLLAAMEGGLLQLEQADAGDDNVGGIFRAAHTIKGGAGVIECRFIEAFTHIVENVLDRVRAGDIPVSPGLVSVMLACCDHIGALLGVLVAGQPAPPQEVAAEGDALRAQLGQWGDDDGQAADCADGSTVPLSEAVTASGGGVVSSDAWHISVRFGTDVLRMGMDPLSFLRYLTTLGEIVTIETLADAMPDAAEMDAESCYLGFEIRFQTRAGKAEIERVFDFCRDDCALHILPPQSKCSDYLQLIQELPEDAMRLGEILVRIGALTQAELDAGLAAQAQPTSVEFDGDESGARAPLGEILVGQQAVRQEVVDAAVLKQATVKDRKIAESRMVRIQADKLDQLIDLVGELVISGASTHLFAQRSGLSELMESTSVLSRLVESIRDAALQLRMVQIGETFNRFNRVVRDASRELGKDIRLAITGGDTELDKSVVEKLGDPLMHLVRNAVDHGIEPAAVRAERGKPHQGTVRLNAYHDSGSIVIEVGDDGGGLAIERIRAKAIARGLIAEDAVMSGAEISNLIFEAGFSTAEQVTNLSGRGVGMDVVRRDIQALRGTIEVRSTEGVGAAFCIRLPLTLAIIDGFLVGVGSATYVVPLDSVVECIELQETTTGRNYLNLRGEVLPFVRLREMFEIGGDVPARQNVVVVQHAGQKAGLVVDRLLGEFQTVIKPLGALFQHLRGIGGSTILGSGEVALILDVPALLALVTSAEEKLVSPAPSRGRPSGTPDSQHLILQPSE